MLVAFFESVKYIGHLIPISFLRIFLGYVYFGQALKHFNTDFLWKPRLASTLTEIVNTVSISSWSKWQIENWMIPYWQGFAFSLTGIEFAIAISYLLGYVVRPIALIAVLLSFAQLSFAMPGEEIPLRLLVAIHLTLAWVGAGRCLGIDYYFYKRRRGIWW
jgi:thiosulfate dehydrogenase (quinone) large subunit